MFEKYTEDARGAIFAARAEAGRHGAREIEPVHILLGILQQREIVPLFTDDLSKLEIIRRSIAQGLPAGHEPLPDRVDLPLAYASKRILAYAAEESELMRHATVDSAHLLLGIHRESRRREKGIMKLFTPATLHEAAILAEYGADYETLRTRLSNQKKSRD